MVSAVSTLLAGVLFLAIVTPGPRLPEGELAPLRIEVDREGRILIGDRPVSGEALVARLSKYADLSRNEGHEHHVSRLPLTIFVTRNTPWPALETAIRAATAPSVRIWRIWIALPRAGSEEPELLPSFQRPETLTPPDWHPRPLLNSLGDITLSLTREPGATETLTCLFSMDYGRGADGRAAAITMMKDLHSRFAAAQAPRRWGAALEVEGPVPLPEVLDLLRECLDTGLSPVTLAPVPLRRYDRTPPGWHDD